MKVLLDECVDWRLAREIAGHEVRSARQMGWATIVLRARTNRLADLRPLVPELQAALVDASRGVVTYVGSVGS